MDIDIYITCIRNIYTQSYLLRCIKCMCVRTAQKWKQNLWPKPYTLHPKPKISGLPGSMPEVLEARGHNEPAAGPGGLELRALGFGFRVKGLRLKALGVGLRALGLGLYWV